MGGPAHSSFTYPEFIQNTVMHQNIRFLRQSVSCALLIVLFSASTLQLHAENRLAKETSPYLRLHAHNPVDWYPWGPEALDKAKAENKVIFLSVGYSSCYWCHVMERESFMDEEIAKFLNDNFICIKVDREERPDIDSIYMLAVQLITGRGGWPMSVFLTPEAKPFFGGTYFPARDGDRGASTGFLSLVQNIHKIWNEKEEDLRTSADQLTSAIRKNLDASAEEAEAEPPELNQKVIESVMRALAIDFDPQYGGFGFDPGSPERPKFPEASNLLFLLEQARAGDSKAREMVVTSLDKMHAGGIWDHVGGGFHRYSVDRFWRIPHFEKMLYDNGQLAVVYSQAYELTKKPSYRRVVERTLDWVIREMRDDQGGFYSALDAESEKVEGKFYRWEKAELQKVLGANFALLAGVYGFDKKPNFEEEFYVPQIDRSLAIAAEDRNMTEAELWSEVSPQLAALLSARSQRLRPLTDRKILASWNGLMIRGLADAGRILDREDYIEVAADAANFVLNKMRNENGRLFRTYTANEAKLNAYLDDYAFVVDGLIALHKATQDDTWLAKADELMQLQVKLFQDTKRGGFYFTSNDHEALIARGKQPSDGAQPAGNSVSVQNLIYLAAKLDKPEYREAATKALTATAPLMQKSPRISPRMALALAEYLSNS